MQAPPTDESRREDAALIARVLARTDAEDACRALVDKYWRVLVAWVHPRTVDASEAEDVAQESFIRAFRALGQLEDSRRFLPWLFRIASNLAADLNRKRRGDQSIDLLMEDGGSAPDLAAPWEDPGAALDRREQRRSVLEAVGRLPDRYRLVVLLRHFEGLSGNEIADALGEPQGTIRNRLFRAHEKLRRLLRAPQAGRGGEDEARGTM